MDSQANGNKLKEEYYNGNGWYRVWDSGLIEQGGVLYTDSFYHDSDTYHTFWFPKEFPTKCLSIHPTSLNCDLYGDQIESYNNKSFVIRYDNHQSKVYQMYYAIGY